MTLGVLTWFEGVLGVALFFSLFALAMTLANLRVYRPTDPDARPAEPEDGGHDDAPRLTVCVPARNEEANLEACVRSLLAQDLGAIEILVYDDGSDDATPDILRGLAAEDPRVVPAKTTPLPEGWNGKQHACWRMSEQARGRWMLFTDADVRFEPSCARRALAFAEASGAGLVSTFPRQITGTLAERLVVPMIFFILFSYLPMMLMRARKDAGLSAACGQFVLARRDAYDAAGGHASVKGSMHEGVKLPRRVRAAGFMTDLFDGTDLCRVRMYQDWSSTWRGFAKNAYEGVGSVGLLVFFTVVHLVAHVLPWLALAGFALAALTGAAPGARGATLAGACVAAHLAQRFVLARRLRTSLTGALLHPVGVLLMTAIQWHSFVLDRTGQRAWRGRVQGASGG